MQSVTAYPGSVASVLYSSNEFPWNNPENAKADDGNYAYVTISNGSSAYTNLLLATNFGFSIPSDRYIVGVKAEAQGYSNLSYSCYEITVLLYYNSSSISNNKKAGTWDVIEVTKAWGDSGDTWGAYLTPSIVNDSSFGFGIRFYFSTYPASVYVDFQRLTIYHTCAPSTPTSAPTMSPSSPTANKRPTFTGYYSDPESDSGSLYFEIWTGAGGSGSLIASGSSSTVSSGSNASWQPSSPISPGTYYCRYKRQKYGLSSDWSPDLSFTITNTAPSTPGSAPSMSPSSPTTNKKPTFTGTFSDPDGDSGYLTFEIRTGASGGGSLIASGSSSTVSSGSNASWQPSSAVASGNYYCRYKSTDSFGLSSNWSPDLSFTISNTAPNTPSSAPTCNASSPTKNHKPTFSGTFSDPDSNDTGKLTFEVRTAPSGGGSLVATGNSSSGLTEGQTGNWTPASNLPSGTLYIRYQRVDLSGSSSGWSPDFTLTILFDNLGAMLLMFLS